MWPQAVCLGTTNIAEQVTSHGGERRMPDIMPSSWKYLLGAYRVPSPLQAPRLCSKQKHEETTSFLKLAS